MNTGKILWSLPTRIMHWALALCVVLNLFILEEGDEPHTWVGYTAVAIVVLRTLWGFLAKDASGFKSFPLSPSEVRGFIQRGMKDDSAMERHNPFASWTYVFMWLLIIGLGVTGFMMGTDTFWGEEWLEELHETISKGLEVLIILHLIGIAMDSFRHKRPTWMGMITGRR